MVAADALQTMVADSGATLLLADDRNAPALAAIGAPLPLAALAEPVPIPAVWPKLRPRDDLCIIYSSGTKRDLARGMPRRAISQENRHHEPPLGGAAIQSGTDRLAVLHDHVASLAITASGHD